MSPPLDVGAELRALSVELAGWPDETERLDRYFPGLAGIVDPLLRLLAALPGAPDLKPVRAALQAGDERAGTRATRITHAAHDLVPAWLVAAKQHYDAHDYAWVRAQAALVMNLALATSQLKPAVVACMYAAWSAVRQNDYDAAVEAYSVAIEVSGAQPNERLAPLLSACHDNLAENLVRLGRFDAALPHYDTALTLETKPEGVRSIRLNKAATLRDLGYHDAATTLFEQNLAEVPAGTDDRARAVTLDNLASMHRLTGRPDLARPLLTEAAQLFPGDDFRDRAVNADQRAQAALEAGDDTAAAAAHLEAIDLYERLAAAALPAATLRAGLAAALAAAVSPNHPAWIAQFVGSLAYSNRDLAAAEEQFAEAARLARQGGDHLLALRADACRAAAIYEARDKQRAWALCNAVEDAAVQTKLAVPASMVMATKAALLDSGVDAEDLRGVLGLCVSADLYERCHREDCLALGIDPDDPLWSPHDAGALVRSIGQRAADAHAWERAVEYFRRGVDQAGGYAYGRVNGRAGLLDALVHSLGTQHPQTIAARDALLAELDSDREPALDAQTTANAIRSLTAQRDATLAVQRDTPLLDAATELALLERGAEVVDALTTAEPAGPRRAVWISRYPLHRRLRTARERGGDRAGAFAALQASRARVLVDALQTARGEGGQYRPPDVDEARRLMSRLGAGAVFVDVTGDTGALSAYVVGADTLQVVTVPWTEAERRALSAALWCDVRRRPARVIEYTRNDVVMARLVAGVVAAAPDAASVLVTVDDELANLPLHLVPVDGTPWGQLVAFGRAPALATLRAAGRRHHGSSVVAGDSAGDLDHAARECADVAAALGCTSLVGPGCTAQALATALTSGGAFDVVHLAVHGRADVRHGGRSSLLLGTDAGPRWVSFDELAALLWTTNLLTLSGCSTAVGGPRDGEGLYGVAQSAAAAGAGAVIASLWPVPDDAAAAIMTRCYARLAAARAAGAASADLREVLRAARDEARAGGLPTGTTRGDRELDDEIDGDAPALDASIAEQLAWDAFVVLGDPVLPLR